MVRARQEMMDAWHVWQQRRSGIPETRDRLVRERYPFLLNLGNYTMAEVAREEVVGVTTAVVA